MEQENKQVVDVNDEAELDKELSESLGSMKAEKSPVAPAPQPAPEEPKPETPSVEAPKEPEPPSPAPTEAGTPAEPKEVIPEEFKTPNKGKFESQESYDKRLELFDLVKARKAATTPEEKAKISSAITAKHKEIRAVGGKKPEDIITNPPNNGGAQPELTPEQQKIEDARQFDLNRAKELGLATKEDIEQIAAQQNFTKDVNATLKEFVGRHPELADEDTREILFGFVESNFNWENKTGKELMTVLEMAREVMFKPSESVQERVLKGANVAEKVNAMQFPGGTIAKPGLSPDKAQSVKEMMEAGMSEEKALELISD